MAVLAALVASAFLPGFTPLAPGPNGGQLFTGTFPGAARPGYVYLPPGFEPSKRYPVVYLLHGMPGSPSEYIDGTQLVTFADGEIASGALVPFIAVLRSFRLRARAGATTASGRGPGSAISFGASSRGSTRRCQRSPRDRAA
jgi:hypothetical protein